jgi:Predicted membrane protein (DUF2142)
MARGHASTVPGLAAVFLLFIGIAWALANPPGAAPDEGAHYVKAIGVGGGDLYGRRPAPTRAEVEALVNTTRSPDERARIEAFLRAEPSASAPRSTVATRVAFRPLVSGRNAERTEQLTSGPGSARAAALPGRVPSHLWPTT